MRHHILFVIGLAALATPAAAQKGQKGYSSSESYATLARVLPSFWGRAASAGFGAEMNLGQGLAGVTSSSSSYEVYFGAARTPAQLPTGQPPLLFGSTPELGDRLGGEPVRIHGYGFEDPPLNVRLGDALVSSSTFVSETVLDVVTGPGVDFLGGNPLGLGAISVSNSAGKGLVPDLFTYTPALVDEYGAKLGYPLGFDVHLPPGALYQLFFGALQFPPIPIGGFEGSLQVFNPLVLLTPILFSPSDHVEYGLVVPDDPSLSGLPLYFQPSVITSLAPFAALFTNYEVVVLEP